MEACHGCDVLKAFKKEDMNEVDSVCHRTEFAIEFWDGDVQADSKDKCCHAGDIF